MIWLLWSVFRIVLVMSAAGSLLFLLMKLCGRGADRKIGVGWKRPVSVVILILLLVPLWIPLGSRLGETISMPQGIVSPMNQAVERFWNDPVMEGFSGQALSGADLARKENGRSAVRDSGDDGLNPVGMAAAAPIPMLIGAVLAVLWIAGTLLRMNRRRKLNHQWRCFVKTRSEPVTDEGIAELLQQEKDRVHLRREVELLRGIEGVSPLIMGILRVKILLPDVEMEKEELRLVLRHELTHLKHQDLIYKYAAGLAAALHWFNPLARQFEKEIAVLCELSCDQALVRDWSGEQRAFYGRTILRLLNRELCGWQGSVAAISQEGLEMKRRLEGIMERKKMNKKTTIAAVGIAAAMCLGGTALALALSPTGASAVPAAKPAAASATASGIADSSVNTDDREAGETKTGKPATELTGQEKLSWPLDDYLITNQYGERIQPLTGEKMPHDGIDLVYPSGNTGESGEVIETTDIHAGEGARILAAADGVVTFSAEDGEHGNRVSINHGVMPDGTKLETSYSHCKMLLVEEGQSVSRNQVIAYVGKTGKVTGNVLHFTVLANGIAVNPLEWLSETNAE